MKFQDTSRCLVTSTFDIQRQAEMRFENKNNKHLEYKSKV